MKFWKYTLLMLTAMLSLFGFSACQDDDDYSLDKFAIEIMTVVPDGDTYYLRRDNGKNYGRLRPIAPVIILPRQEHKLIIPCYPIQFPASVMA